MSKFLKRLFFLDRPAVGAVFATALAATAWYLATGWVAFAMFFVPYFLQNTIEFIVYLAIAAILTIYVVSIMFIAFAKLLAKRFPAKNKIIIFSLALLSLLLPIAFILLLLSQKPRHRIIITAAILSFGCLIGALITYFYCMAAAPLYLLMYGMIVCSITGLTTAVGLKAKEFGALIPLLIIVILPLTALCMSRNLDRKIEQLSDQYVNKLDIEKVWQNLAEGISRDDELFTLFFDGEPPKIDCYMYDNIFIAERNQYDDFAAEAPEFIAYYERFLAMDSFQYKHERDMLYYILSPHISSFLNAGKIYREKMFSAIQKKDEKLFLEANSQIVKFRDFSLQGEYFMFSYLVGKSIEHLRLDVLQLAVMSDILTDETLESLKNELINQHPDWRRITAEAIALEATAIKEMVYFLIDGKLKGEEIGFNIPLFVLRPTPEMALWYRENLIFLLDAYLESQHPKFYRPGAVGRPENLNSGVENANRKFYWFTTFTLTADAVYDIAINLETRENATIAALAVEQFRRKYGKLPEDLTTLVPEFLEQVPIETLSGTPLCLQKGQIQLIIDEKITHAEGWQIGVSSDIPFVETVDTPSFKVITDPAYHIWK